MGRHIQVVPYDPTWPDLYLAEIVRLAPIFGDELVAFYHIGSTAIPGMSAKPTIDILIVVRDIASVDTLHAPMVALGYQPKGENGIPGRRYFRKGSDDLHTHHVHVFQADSPEVDRHLRFRDYMRTHPEQAQAYADLKQDLARRFPQDAESYTSGKGSFIQQIDRQAQGLVPVATPDPAGESQRCSPLDEAREGLLSMSRRVALLHMAYARTLVDALGEEQGRALIEKAVGAYGKLIGERMRAKAEAMGLQPTLDNLSLASDLSPLAFPSERVVVGGEARTRSQTCILHDVWREYGEEQLGSLYCLVDPAKMQAYDPGYTMVHVLKLPDGDACCEIAVRPVDAVRPAESEERQP
jgi:GrpB-like predicted nucleotidyltransferase (UPF0157 family)